jgi:hypothetical protein
MGDGTWCPVSAFCPQTCNYDESTGYGKSTLDLSRGERYDPEAGPLRVVVGGVWGVKRVVGRLLVVLAVAFPVTFALAAGADGATPNAFGPAVVHCGTWKDGTTISPGIGNTASNQTVMQHGRLDGCTRAGGARYSATMQMFGATCGSLAMRGTASFDWLNGTHSTAWLQFEPKVFEPSKVQVSGSITSGMFQGLAVVSTLRFTRVFTGTGAPCSPTNLLRHIDFTNSRSFQLLMTKLSTTTTQPPPPPPTTQPHPTTPNTPPPTVPITNLGGPTTAPPTNAVPAFFQGGPAGPPAQQQFPTGTLAFTGSRSGLAALFGLEVVLIGGALACLDPERRRRRFARFASLRRRPKSFLQVTLPPMR